MYSGSVENIINFFKKKASVDKPWTSTLFGVESTLFGMESALFGIDFGHFEAPRILRICLTLTIVAAFRKLGFVDLQDICTI